MLELYLREESAIQLILQTERVGRTLGVVVGEREVVKSRWEGARCV